VSTYQGAKLFVFQFGCRDEGIGLFKPNDFIIIDRVFNPFAWFVGDGPDCIVVHIFCINFVKKTREREFADGFAHVEYFGAFVIHYNRDIGILDKIANDECIGLANIKYDFVFWVCEELGKHVGSRKLGVSIFKPNVE
jgi:hypothetical protein